jgi:hypothetical protein
LLCAAALGAVVVVLSSSLRQLVTTQLQAFYGYLAGRRTGATTLGALLGGFVTHVPSIVATAWHRVTDAWANVAPGGVIGLLSPWAAGLALLVVPMNLLSSNGTLAVTSFQYLPVYLLLPLGTVFVLLSLARRGRHERTVALGLVGVVVLNALAWAVVWLPQLPAQWLRVQPDAARFLASVESRIPPGADVVASQGIAGRFADRKWIFPITGWGQVPVVGHQVWFVLSASAGIETEQAPATDAAIATLARLPAARLVASGFGVWVFTWNRPDGVHSLLLPPSSPVMPAWLTPGSAGRVVMQGPVRTWRVASTGRGGYVVSSDYWREPLGSYQATVVLSATGPVNVEVWNATGNLLLTRREIPTTDGPESFEVPVDNAVFYPTESFVGVGPLRVQPLNFPVNDQIEVRVWAPSSSRVTVDDLGLRPSPGGAR